MTTLRLKPRRCAIYTRKSSDEGLEQSYNSLAAQRDACAAYIASQKHEGWVPVDKTYDDGGFSGGSMNRPALQELFADLRKGEVDIIVVYKVDRLTRSLADFAKLTELFDQHQVSFVAVTQQFNTSTSMGRLTLNVLLSFAQFEREVTGERIRDKIRASKMRGMWMGGNPSLGYDVKDRKLVVNEKEAATVRHIFKRYLELSSVRLLRLELVATGVTSKVRRHEDGSNFGGRIMLRGAVEYLLKNQIYRGKIIHKGEHFDGQHEPIVSQQLFDAVQHHMTVLGPGESAKKKLASPSLLQGLVFDPSGARLQPSHSNKHGRKYRYYVSSSIVRDVKSAKDGLRIPATDLERLVLRTISTKLKDTKWIGECVASADAQLATSVIQRAATLAEQIDNLNTHNTGILTKIIHRITVGKKDLKIEFEPTGLCAAFELNTSAHETCDPKALAIVLKSHLFRCGKQIKLVMGSEPSRSTEPDPRLVNQLVQARKWYADLASGRAPTIADLAKSSGVSAPYVSLKISLAFLAPDIVEMVFGGTQPVSLTLERLRKSCPLPASWAEQRAILLN